MLILKQEKKDIIKEQNTWDARDVACKGLIFFPGGLSLSLMHSDKR